MPALRIVSISSKIDLGLGGFFSRSRKRKRMQSAIDAPHAETYLHRRFPDGTDRLDLISDIKQVGRLDNTDVFAQVTTTAFPLELTLAGLRDQEETELDVTVTSTWKISDRRMFLREYGLERLLTSSAIDGALVESTLAARCRRGIAEQVRKLKYQALTSDDALPAMTLQRRLPEWVELPWLELVDVQDVRYQSATGDKAAEAQRRQRLLALEDVERQQHRQRELAKRHEQAQFEQAAREIQATRELSELERQQKLQKLTAEHEQHLLGQQREAELAALAHEKEKAGLIAQIEEARNRKEAADEILRRAEEIERRTEERLAAIEAARKEQAESVIIAQVVPEKEPNMVHRLTAAVAGMSTGAMALIGRNDGPAYLAQVFREKASATPDAVLTRMVALRTRDIATRKMDTLPINSPLQFEFMTARPGYVTVLNIGTSGNVYLQAPNAYADLHESFIEAGRRYQFPGPELLPIERLQKNGLQYVEAGPPGWEELIVIVSDQPLVTESDLFRSTPDCPFVGLSPDRIEQLLGGLAYMPEESWNAGALSFLVE